MLLELNNKQLVEYARSFDVLNEPVVSGIIDFYDKNGWISNKQRNVLNNGRIEHYLIEDLTDAMQED